MANNIITDGMFIEVNSIDEDYDPGVIKVQSIQFNPGAASDICVIKQGSDAGPKTFYCKCTDDQDQRVKYFDGETMRPILDFNECTLTSGAALLIQKSRD